MLEYRPRDLDEIPNLADKLLSIFTSQAALPISFLYRERETVTSWQQSKRWLPSVIEDCEVEANAAEMWRRSDDENFFVLNQSIAYPQELDSTPEFYLSDSEVSLSAKLYLEDHFDESREIKLMSAELMLSPELKLHGLKLCVVMAARETVLSTTETAQLAVRHGACLGVRPQTGAFLQMFYIYPVQCVNIDPESSRIQYTASYLFRQTVVEGFDYVLEHGKRPNFAPLFFSANSVFQISPMPNVTLKTVLF
jgi:hypothetical protein